MRLMGMNVQAIPGQPGMTAKESTKTWRKGKKTPVWHASNLPDGAHRWARIKQEIEGTLGGELGLIRYKTGAYPHVVGWIKRKDGSLSLVDPQNVSNDIESELIRAVPGTIEWVNMAGFIPTEATRMIVMGE